MEEFRCGLRDRWGSELKGLIVFGSLARGEWAPESDIDLMVLLDNSLVSKAEQEEVSRLARDLTHKYDLYVQTLVFTEAEYQRGRSPLFFNVRREGMFMEPEDQSTVVEETLAMARQSLHAADILQHESIYDDAVSRAYYAMFNAAHAALLSKGIARSRHKGVLSAFGFHFVRTGLVSSELHNAFEAAYQRRLTADYSPQSTSQEEAETVLKDAQEFVEVIEAVLASQSTETQQGG